MKRLDTKGFTIIELLIATVSFSLILLILTAAVIQFNRLYYKGVVDIKTQETTRAIVDDITRNIQFAAGTSDVQQVIKNSNNGWICAGDSVYRYRKNQLVNSGAGTLRRYQGVPCPAPADAHPNLSGGTELMGGNMYLYDIKLEGSNPHTLTVKVRYGNLADHDSASNGRCRFAVRLGGQFCAANDLSVTVTRRF